MEAFLEKVKNHLLSLDEDDRQELQDEILELFDDGDYDDDDNDE